MKKQIIAALVLVGAASSALGADAPVKKAAAPAIPVASAMTWTGCYIGGNVGGLWGSSSWTNNQPGSGARGQSEGSNNPGGFIGGGQVGCDYQFASNFVLGLQGDISATSATANHRDLIGAAFTDTTKVNYIASVAPRLGYAFDQSLAYLKGGAAWSSIDLSFTDGTNSGKGSTNRTGWTVGVGGEYAITKNVSAFVEYDYYDLGSRDVTTNLSAGGTYITRMQATGNVAKTGVNLRF